MKPKTIQEILEKAKELRTLNINKASILTLMTSPELEEEMILTDEEQVEAVYYAAKRLQEHKLWTLRRRMATPEELEAVKVEDFIELIDAEIVLKKANSNKHYAIWQENQREKEKKDREEKRMLIEQQWTANQMLKFLRWSSKERYEKRELIENEHTLRLIKVICFFLSDDPRFETELGYSFKKGLLLRGICGLGKTYLLKCLSENPRNPIYIKSMIEIAEEVHANGSFELPIAKKWYIDDVGSETAPVNHYGTKINWFKDFLETYYLNKIEYSGLIISTNLNNVALEEKYGFRVRSRVKDMFNVITATGEDLRGK